jgi:uncharacterized protein (TIGR02117 family)
MRRLLKYGLGALGAFVAAAIAYLAAALILGIVPVNDDFRNAPAGTEIFLVSNGVHVDFVLPVRSRAIDWAELFPRTSFVEVDSTYGYLAFGWGERSFYIETPTWNDVRVWTVVRAMLWPTPSVMHVQYLRGEPAGEHTRRVVLSDVQYETLIAAIRSSFQTTADGRVVAIPGKGYGSTDNFYEGAGSYHALSTCNMWTNRLLKETGVRTAVWSPFTEGILYHLDREDRD